MFRMMCKSKIHRAKVTRVELHYEGSIGIDRDLLRRADILPGEIVQVVNINNGSRFETYAIEEKSGSGTIGLYGAATRLARVGDLIIILSYLFAGNKDLRKSSMRVVKVGPKNKPINQV